MKTEDCQNCTLLDLLILEKLGFSENEAKQLREQIPSGNEATIDSLYHVKGKVEIGEDYSTTPTVNIPIKAVLALVVRRLGFQREGVLEIIKQCVKDAILRGEQAEAEIMEATPQAEIMLEQVEQDVLKQLPKTLRKGAVKLTVSVSRIMTRKKILDLSKNKVKKD